MHIRTGLNVRHADEQLRGTIALPNGLGRDVTVAVFAQGDAAREAQEAGADVVGAEDLAKRVEEGFTDFDVAIATPDMMPLVGRLGRILGPPARCRTRRSGPSRPTSRKAVQESKAGKVEYRTDRTAIVHLVIGKTSFDGPRAARELRRGDRGDHPRQAVGGEGALPALDHARLDPGARASRSTRRGPATSSRRRPQPLRSADSEDPRRTR